MKRIELNLLICVSLLIAADVQATDEKVEESYIEKGEGPVAYTLDIGRGSTYAPQNQKRNLSYIKAGFGILSMQMQLAASV